MSRKLIVISVCLVLSLALTASATTGSFTGPLITHLGLSVDLNGGRTSDGANASPTEGWNGSYSAPSFSADPYGVTWQPWGGPTNTYGDGIQLPSSQVTPTNVSATSITKTFGSVTLTVSIPGNASNYGQVLGVASLNSRDRGSPSPDYTADNDLFRDFIFAGQASNAVQSTNYLQVHASGLNAGASYQIALYSYDSSSSGNFMNWTATAPYTVGGYTDLTGFVAPADEQTIAFSSIGAPAVFTVIADASGNINVWGFGGNGFTGNQNSQGSYLNAIQIIPEPATMALLGLGGLALIRRKR